MQPRIVKGKRLNETRSSERCFIAENWSSQKLSIARATVKPGDTTVLHHLEDVDEIYLIVKGKGKVKVGKLEPTKVEKRRYRLYPRWNTATDNKYGKNRPNLLLRVYPSVHARML